MAGIAMLDTVTTTKDDNPFKPVLDVFDSAWFRAALELFGFLVVVLWLSTVFFVYKDARRRLGDPVLIAVAVATALVFPFVGVLVYVILRPPEYLDDVRERELEIRAMERRLGVDSTCPYCRSEIEASFLACPVCTHRLKSACRRCKAPLEPEWRICPYCETEPREGAEPEAETTVARPPRARRARQQ